MFLKGRSRYPLRNPRGSLLIVALWMISLLTLFSFSLSQHVRQKITLADRIDVRNWLYGISETGIYRVLYNIRMKKEEDKGYHSMNDPLTSGEQTWGKVAVGEGTFTIGYPYTDAQNGKPGFHYGVDDEEGKININLLDAQTLGKFVEVVCEIETEEAEGIGYSIVDWRDTDDSKSHPEYGAEDDEYEDLDLPYESKDQLFESIEELLLVQGVTSEIFERLKPFVTIYGTGIININTAAREVLLGLGMEESLVEKILLYRSGQDGTEGTFDDGVFMHPEDLSTELIRNVKVSQEDINQLNQFALKGQLGVNSTFFKIRSYGEAVKKNRVLEIEAVANVEGKIFSWVVGSPRQMTLLELEKTNRKAIAGE